ncbi:MAG: tetratricopeptide repeat protein [bacterium]
MTKALILVTALCALVSLSRQSCFGQQPRATSPVSAAALHSTREQDGLEGPVRRVRVETSKIIVKDGHFVVGPRVLRGVATYDPAGKKIDAVNYPLESDSLPGKQKYRYDEKGNIVEMLVLGDDSSILSKESYEYEFDPLGNWTKMKSSVAVYEDGKVSFEPTEITYRTFSYYFTQVIAKLSGSGSNAKAAATRSGQSQDADSMSHRKSTSQPVVTNQPAAESVAGETSDSVKASATLVPQMEGADMSGAHLPEKPPEEIALGGDASKSSVLKVAEDVLRNAAVDLPRPDYSEAALLARATGKVEVQLLVDKNGSVTNARAISGSPLLVHAAETAARKARFSTSRLSRDGTVVFGIITYDFVLPTAASEVPSAASPTVDNKTPLTAERNPVTRHSEDAKASIVGAKPKTDTQALRSNYRNGLMFLAAGRYQDAVEALNEALRADPNDALSYAKLAMSYSALHQDTEAVANFKMASQIKQSVIDAPAYYMWGGSYLALNKTSAAIAAFVQALYIVRADAVSAEPKKIRRFPSEDQLHQGMGIAYLNAKRVPDAIDEFKQAVTRNPANAEAHYGLALAYLAGGDRRSAENQNKVLGLLDRELAQKIKDALAGPPARLGCLTMNCRR